MSAEPLCLNFKRGLLPAVDRDLVRRALVRLSPEPLSEIDIERRIDREVAAVSKHVIWVSATHQVNIVAEREPLHYSIKRRDKAPIMSRDNLIAIGAHFNRSKAYVMVELYPSSARVVDTANQYHLWRLPSKGMVDPHLIRQALAGPEQSIPVPTDWQFIHLPTGTNRDWRVVQDAKASAVGPTTEAVDILLPETRGKGVLLLIAPPEQIMPFGWTVNLEAYAPGEGWVQRSRS